MGEGLSRDEELKIEASKLINNAALVLLPALSLVLILVLQHWTPTKFFFGLVGLSALFSAATLIFSGLGISQLRRGVTKGPSFFNLQTIFCLLAFILIACSYFTIGERKESDLSKRLGEIQEKLGTNRKGIEAIRQRTDSLDNRITDDGLQLQQLITAQQQISKRLDQISKSLPDFKMPEGE